MSDEERNEHLLDMDDEDSGREPESGAARPTSTKSRRRRRRRPYTGDMFFVFLIFLIALILMVYGFRETVSTVFSPTAGVILLIMVIEYLVLKSMDRTRIYQIENMRLREQRRTQRQSLKRSRDLIDEGLRVIDSEDEQARLKWKSRAEVMSEEIRDRT